MGHISCGSWASSHWQTIRVGQNLASQVFIEHIMPPNSCAPREDSQLNFTDQVVKPKRDAFVQSERRSAAAPSTERPASILYSKGWAALATFLEMEVLAHVLSPITDGRGESMNGCSVTIGKLTHEEYYSEEAHNMKVVRGIDDSWPKRVCVC
eukprot:NODE_8866_length_1464_cov_3.264024.p1 GENE.NODE_8866_length_1464_cov_3.264024~~NODE_8866_length_1464_cov_3.264024.p1  ORF type:complete len:153 (+),score=29.44 NODE_8866_length_1464_cov_3.264024:350-808(+)